MLQGQVLETLQLTVQEHFNPGQPIELLVGLPTDLSDQEVGRVKAELRQQGLPSSVEIGSGPWPTTLRFRFLRPARPRGVAVLPLAILIIGALGAVGVAGILGWQVGEVVKGVGDAMARSLIPLTLVVGGIWLFSRYVEARR